MANGGIPYTDKNGKPLHEGNIIIVQQAIVNSNCSHIIDKCFGGIYSNICINFIKKCLSPVKTRPYIKQLKDTEFYQKYFQVNESITKHYVMKYQV